MRKISRRQALRFGAVGVIALGSTQIPAAADSAKFVPGVVRSYWLRLTSPNPTVAIVRCPSYDGAVAAVWQAWDLCGGPSLQGKRVVLKPNLVDALVDRVAHTAPAVLEGAIDYALAHGASEVVVADGPSFSRDTDDLLHKSGLGPMLARRGVRFVDLNYDDLEAVKVQDNYGSRLDHIFLPRTILDADIVVSVPKLKTHHWAGVTLSLKNLFGVAPGSKYGWPKNSLHTNGIVQSILCLYATVRPHLALVDGVVGMEGDGPVYGSARPTGVVLMGAEPVAVDATATRVMGINPAKVSHLALAETLGLGTTAAERIRVVGVKVEDVVQQFQHPPMGLLP